VEDVPGAASSSPLILQGKKGYMSNQNVIHNSHEGSYNAFCNEVII
jgi:hypothetical protein